MRAATFNIGGAYVPGRKDATLQGRSWHQLASWGVDLAFIQEAEGSAIPAWARDQWTMVNGEIGIHGKAQDWGSVIAAAPTLNLRACPELMSEDPWLRLLYDYVVVGEIDLPDGRCALVASVHAVAKPLAQFLAENPELPSKNAFTPEDLVKIAQPSDVAWVLDVAFFALARHADGQPFLVGGDWNNARLHDRGITGTPVASMFFNRAAVRGWVECHRGNEERSWLNESHEPYQLDHLFCDTTSAKQLRQCVVANQWPAQELSDHAALLADFDFDVRDHHA